MVLYPERCRGLLRPLLNTSRIISADSRQQISFLYEISYFFAKHDPGGKVDAVLLGRPARPRMLGRKSYRPSIDGPDIAFAGGIKLPYAGRFRKQGVIVDHIGVTVLAFYEFGKLPKSRAASQRLLPFAALPREEAAFPPA